MYVCPNCKKEYNDEVAFCSACGSKVEAMPVLTEEAPEKEPFIISLFAFMCNLSNIVSTFFALLAMAISYIDVNISSSYYKYAYAYFRPDSTCSGFAFTFSFFGLGLAIASLIIAGTKKANLKTKFERITSIVIASFLFILSLVLLGNS